jgi:pimeloyl-ACP methyl ester carboxylesterase
VRAGDIHDPLEEAAVDLFLRHVGGDRYREDLDRVVPDAFSEALAGADLFFQAEMPAVQSWSFGPAEAERVTQPVLNVVAAGTVSRFVEGAELIQSWFPDAERMSVPDAGHLMLVQNPQAVAQGLAAFFSRHPIEQTDLARSG